MKNILITGCNGQLGNEIKRWSVLDNWNEYFFEGHNLDITNIDSLRTYVKQHTIEYIVNCAAYTNVDKAEDDYSNAYKVNCIGSKNLGIICKEFNIKLIHISTDYVFNGKNYVPYSITDKVSPINKYGCSKYEGEKEIVFTDCNYMIIRTSWLYSLYGKNFVKNMVSLFKERDKVNVVYDQIGSPTNASDLADFILTVIKDNTFKKGVYHFSNKGVCSWYDFAKEIYDNTKNLVVYKCTEINPCLSSEFKTKAKRPNYSVLNCSDIQETFHYKIPYWKDSLKECLKYMEIFV